MGADAEIQGLKKAMDQDSTIQKHFQYVEFFSINRLSYSLRILEFMM
jgi:hypothetical protein